VASPFVEIAGPGGAERRSRDHTNYGRSVTDL
jgi:hypothetical protein